MTYDNASIWADEHISKRDFDNFEDWLQYATADSKDGLMTPSLLNSSEYVIEMKRFWDRDRPIEDDDDDIPDDDEIRPSEPDVMDGISPSNVSIDSGFVVTRQGAMPVKITSPIDSNEPPIVITQSQANAQRLPEIERQKTFTPQPIPRSNIRDRLSNIATRMRGIATDMLSFFRRR